MLVLTDVPSTGLSIHLRPINGSGYLITCAHKINQGFSPVIGSHRASPHMPRYHPAFSLWLPDDLSINDSPTPWALADGYCRPPHDDRRDQQPHLLRADSRSLVVQ